MSLPLYPKYKDSGVEWIGDVPEHWEVKRLKLLCTVQTGDQDTVNAVDDGQYPFFVRSQTVERIDSFTHNCEAVLTAGDGVGVGKVFHYHKGPFNFHQRVYMLNDFQSVSGFYLFLYVKENFYKVALEGGAKSTVDSLRMPLFLNFPITVPPPEEQSSIVAFLNSETAKIDALVEEQRRLIELLKEKRQAVISNGVTKGLNPDASLKDSGIGWLGKMPTHWNAGSLTRVADRVVVGIAEAATHAYADEGIPILRSTNIRAGRIIGDILRVDSKFASERGSKEIRSGDLITVRTGNAGVTAVIPSELDGCQCFTMLITTLSRLAVPEFYCYYLNGDIAQKYFSIEGWGTAQVNISVPILKSLPVPIPPTEEQATIVSFLDSETTRLDALTAEATHAIDLLRERRSALISAAVTGKIDVRGLAKEDAA